MSMRDVIDKAQADLGYTENPPNSNKTKYGEWYGMNGQPWCCMALWYWFQQAGESGAFFGGAKTASCGTLLRWYRSQGQTVPVSQIRPGDIVILNFSGTKETQHCGLVIAVDGIYITTVEGNTSESGSQSNGGMVCKKTRYPSQIVGVCRPEYKEEEPMPKTDYDNHWAREHIQWGLDEGIITGYQDGSFQPDKACTRAEITTMMHRHDAKLRIEMANRETDNLLENTRLRNEIAELRAKISVLEGRIP